VLLDVAPLSHCFLVAPQRQRQDLPGRARLSKRPIEMSPLNITAIIPFPGFQTTYNALPDDIRQLG